MEGIMKNNKKQKKYNRYYQETTKQAKLTFLQIALRASFAFVLVFVSLFTFFVSAAILPKKVVVTNIARGASINISMPVLKKDELKLIELCRGSLKPKCTVLAKNVLGIKKAVKMPLTYPLGDAVIKVSIGANTGASNAVKTVLSNKKVKITVAKSSGGGGGGGSGGSGSGGSSGGSANNSTSDEFDDNGTNGSSSTTDGTVIRATPTPTSTPQIVNVSHPILINH